MTTTCDVRSTIERWAEGGTLRYGGHRPPPTPGRCAMCYQEAVYFCRWVAEHGEPTTQAAWDDLCDAWTDRLADMPDVRALNDATWPDDAARTAGMLRIHDALAPWLNWSAAQRQDFASRLAVGTVREIVADLPGLPEAVRVQCRSAVSPEEAARAAAEAARAAEEAARAAAWAARAAGAAAEAEAWAGAWAVEEAAWAVEEAARAAEEAARAAEEAARAAAEAARAARAARAAAEAARAAGAAARAAGAARAAALTTAVSLWERASAEVERGE